MNSQPVSPQVGWMDGSLTVNQDEVESFFTAFRLRAGVSAAAYSSTAFSFIFSWPILHRKHSPSRCVPHISTLILHIYWSDIEFVTSSSTIWSCCRVCITVYIWNSERENVVQKRKKEKNEDSENIIRESPQDQ